MHEPSSNFDLEILAAWRDGDQNAGAQLYRQYYGAVARFFRNKVPCGDHEDLAQQTFLALVNSRSRVETSVKRYVLGIAHNLLRQYIRKKRPDTSFDESRMCEIAPGPTSIVARQRRAELLLGALRSLRVSQQIMMELFYWEDYNATQLAEYFEISPSAVRGRLLETRKELSRIMAQASGQEYSDRDLDTWARELRDLVGPDLDKLLSRQA